MSKLKNLMNSSSSYSQLEKAGHGEPPRRHQPSFASFSDIWSDALDEYHLTTAVNLRDPKNMDIVRQLETYVDPDDILNHLDIVSQSFDHWRQGGKWSQRLRGILKPFVRALHKIIEAIAETSSSAGHAPGSKVIFVAILVLLKAADGVSTTFDDIEKLFERFRAYVVRLEKQVMAPIDREMKVLAIRALVEMLRTIGDVTKVLSRGRVWNFMGALVKRSDKIAVAMNKLKEIEYDEDRLNIADLRVAVYDLKRVFEESIAGKQKEDSSSIDDLRGAVYDLRRAFEESVAGKHDKDRLSFADLRRTVYDLKTAFKESVEGRRSDEDPLSIADLCVAVHDLKRVLEENMGDNETVDESSLGLTSHIH
ncbi:hypothetical protein PENSPDRAFT_243328 [Peniophora sp. CONT]|nr:hypothetical protein PENSPDRAFT_243328 [Peniophora sp. CONT]